MLGYCTYLCFCSPKKTMPISVVSPLGHFLMDRHGFVLHVIVYHANCIDKPSMLFFLYIYHTMLSYCTWLGFALLKSYADSCYKPNGLFFNGYTWVCLHVMVSSIRIYHTTLICVHINFCVHINWPPPPLSPLQTWSIPTIWMSTCSKCTEICTVVLGSL